MRRNKNEFIICASSLQSRMNRDVKDILTTYLNNHRRITNIHWLVSQKDKNGTMRCDGLKSLCWSVLN